MGLPIRFSMCPEVRGRRFSHGDTKTRRHGWASPPRFRANLSGQPIRGDPNRGRQKRTIGLSGSPHAVKLITSDEMTWYSKTSLASGFSSSASSLIMHLTRGRWGDSRADANCLRDEGVTIGSNDVDLEKHERKTFGLTVTSRWPSRYFWCWAYTRSCHSIFVASAC